MSTVEYLSVFLRMCMYFSHLVAAYSRLPCYVSFTAAELGDQLGYIMPQLDFGGTPPTSPIVTCAFTHLSNILWSTRSF